MRSFEIVGCTEKGPVRDANEDHILIGRFIKNRGRLSMCLNHDDDFLANFGLLFAVADGVGGKDGGGIASKLAITMIERQFYGVEKKGMDLDYFSEIIQLSAARANEGILKMSASRTELAEMGSTISGVCLTPRGYLVFNAGDSRVYRCRNGVLKPLTRDDSLSSMAVDSAQMSLEEAETSAVRHTLTNCLGNPSFRLAVSPGPELRDNDILLICSDGLHDLVPHEELEQLFSAFQDLDQLSKRLFDEAIKNGGHDNISIILIRSDVLELEDA